MKTHHLIGLGMLMLLAACSTEEAIHLRVSNPLDRDVKDAPVVLNRQTIAEWTAIPDGKVPVFTDNTGHILPGQADDTNKDGKWDEYFFLCDLKAGASRELGLSFAEPGTIGETEARTNLRLGVAEDDYMEHLTAERLEGISYHNHSRTGELYQMEGPAWENELVGFRNYMDQRNGMDIFGKIRHELVLDSVGLPGTLSYHEPADWGMDILKVGTSLGAGAMAFSFEDSLYRLGDNGGGNYELVFEGPLRSRLALNYTKWKLADKELDVKHLIEITAGSRYYSSTVSCPAQSKDLNLVCGIVNMKSKEAHFWDLGEGFSALVTHDLQAEDGSWLAMALVLPSAAILSWNETADSGEGITQSYYLVLKGAETVFPVRFYALWEKEDARWASLEEIRSFLIREADAAAHPIQLEVLNN